MLEAAGGDQTALQALHQLFDIRIGLKDGFDRNHTVLRFVTRPIDCKQRTVADLLDNLIALIDQLVNHGDWLSWQRHGTTRMQSLERIGWASPCPLAIG